MRPHLGPRPDFTRQIQALQTPSYAPAPAQVMEWSPRMDPRMVERPAENDPTPAFLQAQLARMQAALRHAKAPTMPSPYSRMQGPRLQMPQALRSAPSMPPKARPQATWDSAMPGIQHNPTGSVDGALGAAEVYQAYVMQLVQRASQGEALSEEEQRFLVELRDAQAAAKSSEAIGSGGQSSLAAAAASYAAAQQQQGYTAHAAYEKEQAKVEGENEEMEEATKPILTELQINPKLSSTDWFQSMEEALGKLDSTSQDKPTSATESIADAPTVPVITGIEQLQVPGQGLTGKAPPFVKAASKAGMPGSEPTEVQQPPQPEAKKELVPQWLLDRQAEHQQSIQRQILEQREAEKKAAEEAEKVAAGALKTAEALKQQALEKTLADKKALVQKLSVDSTPKDWNDVLLKAQLIKQSKELEEQQQKMKQDAPEANKKPQGPVPAFRNSFVMQRAGTPVSTLMRRAGIGATTTAASEEQTNTAAPPSATSTAAPSSSATTSASQEAKTDKVDAPQSDTNASSSGTTAPAVDQGSEQKDQADEAEVDRTSGDAENDRKSRSEVESDRKQKGSGDAENDRRSSQNATDQSLRLRSRSRKGRHRRHKEDDAPADAEPDANSQKRSSHHSSYRESDGDHHRRGSHRDRDREVEREAQPERNSKSGFWDNDRERRGSHRAHDRADRGERDRREDRPHRGRDRDSPGPPSRDHTADSRQRRSYNLNPNEPPPRRYKEAPVEPRSRRREEAAQPETKERRDEGRERKIEGRGEGREGRGEGRGQDRKRRRGGAEIPPPEAEGDRQDGEQSESESSSSSRPRLRKRSGLWDKQEPQVSANDMFQELGLKMAAAQPGHKNPSGNAMLPSHPPPLQPIMGAPQSAGNFTLLPKGAAGHLQAQSQVYKKYCIRFLAGECFDTGCLLTHAKSEEERREGLAKIAQRPCQFGAKCYSQSCMFMHPSAPQFQPLFGSG